MPHDLSDNGEGRGTPRSSLCCLTITALRYVLGYVQNDMQQHCVVSWERSPKHALEDRTADGNPEGFALSLNLIRWRGYDLICRKTFYQLRVK